MLDRVNTVEAGTGWPATRLRWLALGIGLTAVKRDAERRAREARAVPR